MKLDLIKVLIYFVWYFFLFIPKSFLFKSFSACLLLFQRLKLIGGS